MTENPYTTPGASLEAPAVIADARGMRRVRLGIYILIATEIAAIGIRFVPQYLGPIAMTVATVLISTVWVGGVFVATTPVTERSPLLIAARGFAVAAMLSSITLLLWKTRVEGLLTGGALWANYGVSATAAIANAGAQCLILLVLRPVLMIAGDLPGLRANTIGVWLVAVALVAQQINTWAWRFAGNEIVATLERFEAVSNLGVYRGLSVLIVGVLSVAGFVYYLGGLIRIRRHCAQSLRSSGVQSA